MTGVFRVLSLILAASVIALAPTRSARAGMVTVDFSGSVTGVNTSAFPGTAIGDSFSGKLIYDSSQAPSSAPGANPAVYTYAPPIGSLGISLTLGGTTFDAESGDAMQIQIANNFMGFDAFIATAFVNVGGTPTRVDFALQDLTAAVFSSTALPTSVDLSKFTKGLFSVPGPTGGADLLDGKISLASVPEPSAAVLLGLGAVGAGFWLLRCRVTARAGASRLS
jgi:hypothetical protein